MELKKDQVALIEDDISIVSTDSIPDDYRSGVGGSGRFGKLRAGLIEKAKQLQPGQSVRINASQWIDDKKELTAVNNAIMNTFIGKLRKIDGFSVAFRRSIPAFFIICNGEEKSNGNVAG